MSSTRRAAKRKATEIESDLDMTNPKNWTKEKLITEINSLGIKVPNSLRVAALVQIYNDNKKDETQNMSGSNNKVNIEATGAMFETNSSAEAAAAQVMRTLANSSERSISASDVHVIGPTLSYSQPNTAFNTNAMSASVPDSVFSVQNTFSGMMNCNSQQFYDMDKVMAAMRQPGVAAENYRNMEIVSPHLRSQILAGKDINLALLLMPNNDTTSEHRRVDFDGTEYIMKPGDPRLSKNLTLGEFIVAFARYKNIVCEVMPHRRTELDHYERDVVEMANQFGGTRFYDYHKAFSAKAAALLHQRQIKVDWSIRDNGLFCTMFAGMKINVCGLCSSVNHASDFCPLLVNTNLKKSNQGNTGYNRYQAGANGNGNTRRIPSFQGVQLCMNFNERSCTRQVCKFLHLCYECFSPHPKTKCQLKSNDNTEMAAKRKEKKTQDKPDKINQ